MRTIIASDIEWLGHPSVIVKVKERTARILREYKSLKSVQTESPAAYDSQSDGGVEAGIRVVRELFKSLKLCRGARIGHHLPVQHALIPWLPQHTCTLLNA